MSAFRIPRSVFLAIMSARQSIVADAPIEARQAAKILEGVDVLTTMVRSRAAHIGLVNELFARIIEDGELLDALGTNIVDEIGRLLQVGLPLAVETSGLSPGARW